ncbi:hypothetical protein PVK06_021484 [Gossypium arboreum]|uniref:Serine/threonine-protein phosphatase 4 regulatory subunit 3-like central domain-containing protein n=1 Tax=Gossypium arboreum TaxID=29729 RepID=A0ABR0PQV2_GOSAR|nr:hypothetical protein PVK06_021484 [Gossypium arboreum]
MEKSMSKAELSKEMRMSPTVQPSDCGNSEALINYQRLLVGYLKDVVLARVLDEATAASLNSIIHSNNAIVISILKDDSTFIQELFARLRSPTTSAKSKKNLILA